MVLVIPFTGELTAERFPFTRKIVKNNSNSLSKDSVALVFQMKSISKERFRRKIGRITNNDYKVIETHIKNIYRL